MEPIAQSNGPSKKSADIIRAELERKKRDLYKIYNPTNQAHQVVLNAAISPEIWTIDANNEAVVPFYVAEKYFEEMSQKIITAKSDKAVIEENERRETRGFHKLDLHTEQFRFESKNLKIMMGKREQIVKILNRGLYKEYGLGNTDQIIDRRERKETFDPGVDLSGPAIPASPVPPSSPTGSPEPSQASQSVQPPPPPPTDTIKVEEEPDEPEGEAEEIKNG